MALDQKFFKKSTAATGLADQAQGLVAHLDANDVDSYDGDGSIWYDIANHEVNIPLADKASNLQLHLNASDTTSYSGSGTTWTDISGNDRHGTITDPVFESGLEGGLDFNSATGTSGDKVAVAHNAAFNQQNNMTFEVWVKRDGTTEDNIFYKGGAAGNSYFLTYNPSWGYYFYTYALGGGTYTGTSGLNTGIYEHVVVTIDGSGNRKIYVNGNMSANNNVNSATGTGTLTDTGPLTIGGYYTYAAHGGFDGRISVVRIYNTVLTAAEIGQNYRAGNFLSYSSIYSTNLQANLDAGDTTTLTASTWSDKANSNNGTFNNFSSTLSDFYDKELGNWIDFDGSNDYLQIPASTNLDIGSGGFTYETWLLNEKSSGTSSVISNLHNVSGYTGYTLRINNGTDVNLFIYNNTAVIFDQTASSSVTTNTWTHLAFTVASASSGAAVKLYINGILSSVSGTLSGAYGGSGQNIQAGQYPFAPSGRYFNGKVGVLKFHSEELTAAEIAQNYLATKNDYPNGNNATLINTPAWGTYNQGGVTYNYFDLNGSNHYMTIPHNTIFDFTEPTTMELWVSRDSTNRDFIIDKGIWQFEYNGSSYVFQLTTGGGTIDVRTSVSGTGSWEHIAITFNPSSTEAKLYLNGVLKHTHSLSGNASTNTSNVTIGKYSLASGYDFDGKIGMIKFHAKTFSATEVTAAYNNTKGTYGIT